jgi:quercetin dioxygenase-like cupin family protein
MNDVATKPAPYTIAGREVVAETADLRVSMLTLAPGEVVPWHCHTRVSDTTFCLEGEIEIETRAPRASCRLAPGDRHDVPAKRAHIVRNVGSGQARFLIVQGVGAYDFIPVGG